MKPLRVQITLDAPVASGAFPRLLDGLLAWCATQDALTLANDEDDPRPLRELGNDLPLERVPVSGGGLWKASAWMPVGRVLGDGQLDPLSVSGATQSRKLVRRSDVDEIAYLMGEGFISSRGFKPHDHKPFAMQLSTDKGLLKNSLVTYSLKMVHAVEAWCIGDQDMIEMLLMHAEFIGAKRRLGHGKVRSTLVEEDERAAHLWALRPLPAEVLDKQPKPSMQACSERVPMDSPLCAPYWDSRYSVRQAAPLAMFW